LSTSKNPKNQTFPKNPPIKSLSMSMSIEAVSLKKITTKACQKRKKN